MRKLFLGVIVVVLLSAGACGGGDGKKATPSTGAQSAAAVVKATGTTWEPDDITVKVGDVVEWNVDGSIVHDLHGDDDLAHKAASKFVVQHTYEDAGTYSYLCSIHPTMKGTVTVSP
jgi:plastocyanin